jgi:hypothetical protein
LPKGGQEICTVGTGSCLYSADDPFGGQTILPNNTIQVVPALLAGGKVRVYELWFPSFISETAQPFGNDIKAVYATVEARLVVIDSSKPDDRNKANFTAELGYDFWNRNNPTNDYSMKEDIYGNPIDDSNGWQPGFPRLQMDGGNSRYKLITNEWQSFNVASIPTGSISSLPPPMGASDWSTPNPFCVPPYVLTIDEFMANPPPITGSSLPDTTPVSTPLSPDLIVTSVSYANGIFTSIIKNQGTAATPSGAFIGVDSYVDGNYKIWGGINGPLAVGASATVLSAQKYDMPTGTHTIMGIVDPSNKINESNETNNKFSLSILNGALLPDLIVTSVTYSNGIFTSIVKNQGTASIPSGVFIVVDSYVDGNYKIWGGINGPLAVGASIKVLSAQKYAMPKGTHTMMGIVDNSNKIVESNETNNKFSLSKKIP